jgi:hypothetical protein
MTLTLGRVIWIGLTLALLAGCSYDYLQHTDRVSYAAGDAVKHNLEAETTKPDKRSAYDKSGLGRNGKISTASADDASSAGE